MKTNHINPFNLLIKRTTSSCHVLSLLQKSIICILLLLTSRTSSAQDDSISCMFDGQNDLSPAGIMLGHPHMAHMWMFSYSYMNSVWKDNKTGTSTANDLSIYEKYIMVPRKMQMNMHMLMGMYGLSDKLSFMLMVNYQSMNMTMSMLPSSMNMDDMMNMTTSSTEMQNTSHGFGDSKVYAGYSLYSCKNQSIVLDVGISIPTGSITKTDQKNIMFYGQRLSYMMQLGSGTFDLLPGITYTYRRKSFSWSAQLTSALHPFYNKAGYKWGNEFAINTWADCKWVYWFSSSLRVLANSTGTIQGTDHHIYNSMEPSASPENYGGKAITALVGVNFFLKDELLKNSKIAVEYGSPLYQYANGIQLTSKHFFNLTWFLNF
jgi:hypothetical protein